MNSNDTPCPCGGNQIHTCCGPFLAGTAVADTPEKLMDPIQWLKWGSNCIKEPSAIKEFMIKYSDWDNEIWDGLN